MGSMLDAAIEYATKYDWAVFPIKPEEKRPLTPHGCKDAKKDVGAIRAWWTRWPDANIGIATGSISNLIVIDEDIDEDKGYDGIQSIRQWEQINGELPETCMAITGRGGSHLYYRYEGSDIGNRAGLLEGVDVRGEGGYVIAPPSVHPNGTDYVWEIQPDEIAPAELDDTVKQLLSEGIEHIQGSAFKVPESIPSGQRNDTLYRLACSLQSKGIPDSAILAAVLDTNNNRCETPLSDDEIKALVASALRHKKGELEVIRSVGEWREPDLAMKLDRDGNVTDQPTQTIANAEEAIAFDKDLYGRICWNELAYSPYALGSLPWRQGKGWREWDNADDSNLRSYIEEHYKLKSADKIMDALNNVCHRRIINPVKDLLRQCHGNWDGNKHIENLLPTMLGVEKTEYSIAVMHIIMQGAIRRAFEPGCKFDYMLVLVGEQGGRKSTFLRCLALSDEWFNDNFSSLDNTHAVENLRGMWIVELAELQATKRAKDVETIKSFITSRADVYRAPYNRRTEKRPRRCILCGTSNPVDFLTDKTGNRRFLPVRCDASKATYDIASHEDDARMEMAQAWGEAMHYYEQHPKEPLVLPADLQQIAMDEQERYLEEDPKIGVIQEWLDHADVDRVCVLMLWKEALKKAYDEPTKREINELHDIMRNSITGWKAVGKQKTKGYGVQRCYDRDGNQFIENNDNYDLPFQ